MEQASCSLQGCTSIVFGDISRHFHFAWCWYRLLVKTGCVQLERNGIMLTSFHNSFIVEALQLYMYITVHTFTRVVGRRKFLPLN